MFQTNAAWREDFGARHGIVLDDRARLPQRFFGRFTTTIGARLIGGR